MSPPLSYSRAFSVSLQVFGVATPRPNRLRNLKKSTLHPSVSYKRKRDEDTAAILMDVTTDNQVNKTSTPTDYDDYGKVGIENRAFVGDEDEVSSIMERNKREDKGI